MIEIRKLLIDAVCCLTAMFMLGCAQRELSAGAGPAPARPDPGDVARGASLAAIGNCSICHTADGGATFAGGRPLQTPFGTIYATNITPDTDTGIGRWTLPEFLRAMHDGIDPQGRQLYPAFPYDHYTHVSDDDVAAIYAYLITRPASHAETPSNSVVVPRPMVAVWKALYLQRGPIVAEAGRSDEWNRGRYLVDGLGHCGGCHTPRNALGAEESSDELSGGSAEGWRAPALNERVAAPLPWTVPQMTTYLRTGYDPQHGVAAGPMAAITDNLATVPERDVRAIAVYVTDRMNNGQRERAATLAPPLDQNATGATLYDRACAGCHDRARRGIALDRSTTVTDTTPTNLLRITQDGITPPEGERGPIMPGFRGAFTDAQMTALVTYIRARYGHASPWPDLTSEIEKSRPIITDGKKS